MDTLICIFIERVHHLDRLENSELRNSGGKQRLTQLCHISSLLLIPLPNKHTHTILFHKELPLESWRIPIGLQHYQPCLNSNYLKIASPGRIPFFISKMIIIITMTNKPGSIQKHSPKKGKQRKCQMNIHFSGCHENNKNLNYTTSS